MAPKGKEDAQPETIAQQQKAKMPAAGATQALSAVLQPVGGHYPTGWERSS